MSALRLRRLLALAREHDAALYAWLADGWVEYRAGEPLEHALGLVGSGPRLRDAALREAALLLTPSGTRWARARALAAAVRRVRRGIVVTAADRKVSEADEYARVPSSVRQLYRILG